MVDQAERRNPVEQLGEEFIERHRNGERPSMSEYVADNPELAEEIERLFPTILAMERFKTRKLSGSARPVELRVERLEQLGDYRIIREIGRGGMGIVFEAEQQSLGRHVAVKVFPQQALGDSKHLRRFHREAQTAARLHHTNIVQVFGVGEQDGMHYYVMQRIAGVGLDEVIDRLKAESEDAHVLTDPRADTTPVTAPAGTRGHSAFTAIEAACKLLDSRFSASNTAVETSHRTAASNSDSQTSSETGAEPAARGTASDTTREAESGASTRCDGNYWRSVARVGIQVADALRYAHAQDVLHRDIKPSNLMLDRQGTVWVTDFGLAKAVAQERLSQTGDVLGTLRYMAPEHLGGNYDVRSDVYSLGLTLYELLTLTPAFNDSSRRRLIRRVAEGDPTQPRKLRPDIPSDLETIVLKAIARDPHHRYQSAGEFGADLRRYLEDRPIQARRVGPIERLRRWSRRNPVVATLSAVLLFVVCSSFAAISWKWREAVTEKQRAVGENRRAENNLSLALDSMDQVLDRFTSSWMAHPADPENEDGEPDDEFRMVVSDQTAEILQDALRFYDQFAQQNATNPRLQRATAKAHGRVGDIHERLGQYGKAEVAYLRAVKILVAQREQFPKDTQLTIEAAATLNALGGVFDTVSRYEDARVHFDRAKQILTSELEGSEESPHCLYELARTHSNLGSVLWRLGQRLQSERSQRQAVYLLQELVDQYPKNANYGLALARAYRRFYPFAAFHPRRGDPNAVRSAGLSILEQLVADFPDVPDYRCELSEMLVRTNIANRRPNSFEKVDQQLQRAVDLSRQLAEEFPTIPRYRAALARALQVRAALQRGSEQATAEALYRESVGLYQSLASDFAEIHVYQLFLGIVLHEHGMTLRDMQRLPESRRVLEHAIDQQQAYMTSRGDPFFSKGRLAWQYESLAKTLRKMDEVEAAVEAEQAAKEIREELDRLRRRRGG